MILGSTAGVFVDGWVLWVFDITCAGLVVAMDAHNSSIHEQSEMTIEHDIRSSQRARRAVQEFVADQPYPIVEIAQLLVSELVDNAILHGEGTLVLHLRRSDHELLVSVSDEADQEPEIRDVTIDEQHGRGLRIIDAFASRWGVKALPGHGKEVWIEMELPPAVSEARRGSETFRR